MPVEARSSRRRRGRPPKNGFKTSTAPSLVTERTGLPLSSSSSPVCSSLPSSLSRPSSIPSSSSVSSVSSSLTSSFPRYRYRFRPPCGRDQNVTWYPYSPFIKRWVLALASSRIWRFFVISSYTVQCCEL